MKSKKAALIIFIKNPELGKVKTRISASEGDKKALDIYIELLEHTRRVVEQLDVEKYLFYSKYIDVKDQWSDENFNKKLQVDVGDLGNKMKNAIESCFVNHDKVLIIGSDCAQISPEHIKNAIKYLDENDVVIGPSFDGGYYLLGMNSLHESLFNNIAWSTENVFSQTVDKIMNLGLSHAVTDQLSDIDYIEDWKKWGWEI